MTVLYSSVCPGAFLALTLTFAGTPFAAQAADEAPVMLVPHRAVYELALSRARDAAQVASVRGRILYDFDGNACEGYTLKFRQVSELELRRGQGIDQRPALDHLGRRRRQALQVHLGEFPRPEPRRHGRRARRARRRRHRHRSRQARPQGARYRRRGGVSDRTYGAGDRSGARGQTHSRLSGL